jgi:hypothetical protein
MHPNQHLADFVAFLLSLDLKHNSVIKNMWPDEASILVDLALRMGNPDRAKEALWRYTCYRSAFTTVSGEFGLGPGAAKEEDLVVLFWGGQVCYVVREDERRYGQYVFVGECYVDGWMKGEAQEKLQCGSNYEERIFRLV